MIGCLHEFDQKCLKDMDEDIFEVLKFIYRGKTFDEYND
jgi:hypothetical protein